MSFMEGFKHMIQSWLEIAPAQQNMVTINESLDFKMNAEKNKIWMRGDPFELDQLYKGLNIGNTKNAMFWSAVPDNPIRKIHTGLPGLIVERLTDIVMHDFDSIDIGPRQNEWDDICSEDENNFNELMKNAVKQALYIGDGAFKISYDEDISKSPIIEFIAGDNIDFIVKRGRLKEVVFKKFFKEDQNTYCLREHYGYGYIKYELTRILGGSEVLARMDETKDTEKLVDIAFGGYEEDVNGEMVQRGSYIMAVPFKIFDSSKWSGRGMSVFDRKISDFDAFDEIVSQWADAVRAGRAKTYIPETLIPKDMNGNDILPSPFDDHFVRVGNNLDEDGRNQISIQQPSIPSDNYLQSYISFLDLCLQGLISPSTLGIDTKKLDNAEAQREKEKTTLYTRNAIIDALDHAIPKLVHATLATVDTLANKFDEKVMDTEVSIQFGEYANPSFEAVVETVAKAKQGGVMSTRTAMDEMYGETKEDAWKDEEVLRIAQDQGSAQLPEPNVNADTAGEDGNKLPVN